MQITLTAEALEFLIKTDPEFIVQIKKEVVESFGGKYLENCLSEVIHQKIAAFKKEIYNEVILALEQIPKEETFNDAQRRTESRKKLVDRIIQDMIKIERERLLFLYGEKIEKEIETRWENYIKTKDLEKEFTYYVKQYLKELIQKLNLNVGKKENNGTN